MKLDFLSIRAKNFMQIGNDYAEFNLHKDPFTVIVGKNGTGKSTLLDMICYVLFNKPYRVKFTLSQLVNSTNKKQMVVEVAFKVGNQSYVVRRGEKPKVFEIYKDKELIKADPSIGDMQTYLETQILKQGFKSFCQINVIGKSSYKQFLTLTPAERRAVVEDILDSSIYSDMAALAKVDYKTLSTEIDQYVSDMRILESQIQNTDALIRRYEADRSEEVDRVKRQITETESAIATTKELISEVEARIETAETNLNSVIPPQHLNRFNDERTKLISAIGGFDSAKSKANTTLSKIDSMSTCPHCLQVVDANHKAEISQAARDEIAQADENLNLLKSKLAKIIIMIKPKESLMMSNQAGSDWIQKLVTHLKHWTSYTTTSSAFLAYSLLLICLILVRCVVI
jgi:DNA repair exonuclease SbcCD ATPase subunit